MIDRSALPMLGRRRFCAGAAVALAVPAPVLAASVAPFVAQLAAVERHSPADLGAYVLDTGSGQGFGWRADERFAFCSAFKLSLAAMVFWLARRRQLRLDERIRYGAEAMLDHAPITSQHLGEGMTLVDLAHAALVESDNPAANLLLHRVGGPAALTAFWRGLGDGVSRLDHIEPALNHVARGALPDTTTPRAMAHTLARVLVGDVLSAPHREILLGWMAAVTSGARRIRAGLPADWWAGDKTGTGLPDTLPAYHVDLTIVRPTDRAPLIITGFTRSRAPLTAIDPASEAALAEVGRIAANWVMGADR